MDTYEKKYKEALERARKELQTCGSQDCDAARQIFRLFPELAESEDERIRKAVIEMIHYTPSIECEENYNVRKEEALTWLVEKQGEKPQGKTALEAINEEKVDNANKVDSIKLKEPDGYDDNIKWSDTDKLLMRLDKIVDCNIDQLKCLNNIFDKLNKIS